MNVRQTNRPDVLDQVQHVGLNPAKPAGKAADQIQMEDSSSAALTETKGVKVGDLLLYPAPPFGRITVEDLQGKTYRDGAAVQILFAELRALAANAKTASSEDKDAAIAASLKLI